MPGPSEPSRDTGLEPENKDDRQAHGPSESASYGHMSICRFHVLNRLPAALVANNHHPHYTLAADSHGARRHSWRNCKPPRARARLTLSFSNGHLGGAPNCGCHGGVGGCHQGALFCPREYGQGLTAHGLNLPHGLYRLDIGDVSSCTRVRLAGFVPMFGERAPGDVGLLDRGGLPRVTAPSRG